MTNYNKRLDELEEQFLADYRNWNDGLWDYNGLDPKQKFHQAITSLIKELVAEAIKKPHILPKNAQHLESVKQGINFYHRQMLKRVDKLKEEL